MKIGKETGTLFGQKYSTLYIKTSVHFIVADDINFRKTQSLNEILGC
jgi:hypothetical protein